ncbi:hypothetical protein [Desulfovibrio gilichinskyi]|uniref:Prophage minor tail protein Z (GPZ) n=1 Tax=Desulfovibrio gilichinskyi TaxID=1519643 RepID=A0A1X7CGY9_9BACT|nr:hypothetical protein [Desulfovibrio gilichinskyi]SME96442.1 hypothetical protein SAMN06295933_0888 [Desulfovibrio gilichinskyi]
MSNNHIRVDANKLDMIAADFAATEKQIDIACKRAIAKTARHLRVVALRSVSQLTGIKQNILKKRINVSVWGKKKKTGSIWFGQMPVPLREMNPKQDGSGVTAGGVHRNHAFIANRKSDGRSGVYRRVPKRLYVEKVFHESEAYGRISRLQLGFSDSSFPQYPIVPQYESIDRIMEYVIQADVLKAFENKFYTFFEREIRWESKK